MEETMIARLKIERFKSIRTLDLECRRVNLFIGEPNTGKSNILEALGLLSWLAWPRVGLKSFVRFSRTQNLFYDNLTDEPVLVECSGEPPGRAVLKYESDRFQLWLNDKHMTDLDHEGASGHYLAWTDGRPIRLYRYRPLEHYQSVDPGTLIPPDGPNLFSVIYASRQLREWLTALFRPFRLDVLLEPMERSIKLVKQQSGLFIALPLHMSSETLQRILFFHVAIASSTNSVLLFEEPEAHAFPYYTRQLGEQIAADPSNQYFIATHNPYLLEAVLETGNAQQVAVFVTRYEDHETKVVQLTDKQISRLLEQDPFLGLETVLEAE
ncbi:AAA family ATPase [Limisphaera sp. VF-2]|jgi:predicted ATPase|uniref:AAA family ATPase n=1 Tax=Limisphaera sp. VF-2 TaxID=3400418 RepID=UPI0017502A60